MANLFASLDNIDKRQQNQRGITAVVPRRCWALTERVARGSLGLCLSSFRISGYCQRRSAGR
ncbi:hypothetical protein BD779DRAFT_1578423 [Infundibulicybe gibba]|nr:hypothetical protein BD779DRAFT_1578423 [Infundibulicybe gibba]